MKNYIVSAITVGALFITGCDGGGGGGGGGTSPTPTPTPTNHRPIANVGPDANVSTGSLITLNGTASSDADGDSLTYQWTITSKPSGSTATLSSPTSPTNSFTADIAGTYLIQLQVNDGNLSSTADSLTVTVSTANSAPVANAGADQTVVAGDRVYLDGSASSDSDGDSLSYRWELSTKPAGSGAILSSTTAIAPSFWTDVAGQYVLSLTVNDGTVNGAASAVAITASVANIKPVANAGSDQAVTVGDTVSLSGIASTDANGDPLSYRWSISSKPAASAAALVNATTDSPQFVADASGLYVLSLIANDGHLDSSPDNVSITANLPPPAPLPVGSGIYAQDFTNFYKLDEESGLLTLTASACDNFTAADVAPDGMVIALSSFSTDLVKVDVLTGSCTVVATLPEEMRTIAVASDGRIFTTSDARYFGVSRMYEFSATYVQINMVAVSGNVFFGSFSSPGGLDFLPDGTLIGSQLGNIWSINTTTGVGQLKAVTQLSDDIDIDSAGILRGQSFGVLYSYSTSSWDLIGSRTLEQDLFSFAPLIFR